MLTTNRFWRKAGIVLCFVVGVSIHQAFAQTEPAAPPSILEEILYWDMDSWRLTKRSSHDEAVLMGGGARFSTGFMNLGVSFVRDGAYTAIEPAEALTTNRGIVSFFFRPDDAFWHRGEVASVFFQHAYHPFSLSFENSRIHMTFYEYNATSQEIHADMFKEEWLWVCVAWDRPLGKAYAYMGDHPIVIEDIQMTEGPSDTPNEDPPREDILYIGNRHQGSAGYQATGTIDQWTFFKIDQSYQEDLLPILKDLVADSMGDVAALQYGLASEHQAQGGMGYHGSQNSQNNGASGGSSGHGGDGGAGSDGLGPDTQAPNDPSSNNPGSTNPGPNVSEPDGPGLTPSDPSVPGTGTSGPSPNGSNPNTPGSNTQDPNDPGLNDPDPSVPGPSSPDPNPTGPNNPGSDAPGGPSSSDPNVPDSNNPGPNVQDPNNQGSDNPPDDQPISGEGSGDPLRGKGAWL